MKTIKPSPKQLLREMFPIVGGPSRSRVKAGDWQNFHVGDYVYDVGDERHRGHITKIINSAYADIKWEETGHRSLGIMLRFLRHVTDD